MNGSATDLRLQDYSVQLAEFDAPGNLDYFTALDADDLFRLALPPRPDRLGAPMLHRHWIEMLEDVERVEQAVFAGDLGTTSTPKNAPNRIEASRNWSGAWLVPSGRRFERVIGKWRAPRVRKARAAAPLQPNCSVWIGFGGHRYWSKAMPQMGTEHRAESHDGTQPERHVAWLQWWVRSSDKPPFQPQILANPRVKQGDTILSWIELLSSRRVRFFIRNLRFPILYRAELDMSKATVRGVDAFGSSAEWIVERPRDFTHIGRPMFPLADFSRVRFSHCEAGAGSRPDCPRMVRMVETHGPGAVVLSVPRRRGEQRGTLLVKRTGPTP